jgi:hypothetical protein
MYPLAQVLKKLALCFAIVVATPWLLTQCANSGENAYMPAPAGSEMSARSAVASCPPPPHRHAPEIALDERPGLGTKLGHQIYQNTASTHFYRRHKTLPDATASFYYNDEEGAKLMARIGGGVWKHSGSFELIPGKLKVSVRSSYGRYAQTFKHYIAQGRIIVIGQPGANYELVLTNLMANRVEVVASIDGLDVRTGRSACISSPGYVLAAKASMTIPGMLSGGVMRAFQFSSVAESHAATAFGEKGARNVGVMGVALYEEDELARRRVRIEDNYLRDGARAFGN